MIDPVQTKRHSDENLKEWKIRICSNKDIYNLNWEEIKELINKETGESKGESAYRKWFNNFIEGVEYQRERSDESNNSLLELELKKVEIMEERKKLACQFQRAEGSHRQNRPRENPASENMVA